MRSVFALPLLCSLGGVWLLAQPEPRPQPTPPPVAASRATSRVGGPSNEAIARLSGVQRAQAEEIARLRAELDALREARSSDGAPLSEDPAERLALEQELEEARFELFDLALEQEPADPDWAPAQTVRMRESFARALPGGSSLDTLACRSSLCRAELRHESEEAREQAIAALPQAGGWDTRGSVHITEDASGLYSTFYVAREGMGLPDID